jgi:Domain of unknown function (DUF4159)
MRTLLRASPIPALVTASCLTAVTMACGGSSGAAGTARSAPDAGPPPPFRGLMAQQVPQRYRRYRDQEEIPAAESRVGLVEPQGTHEFTWTRAIYTGLGRGWGGWGGRGSRSWATDYPKADYQFLVGLKRLIHLDAYDGINPVGLADPDLRRYPLLYSVEVGHWDLTPEEIHGLRDYLDAGGFLICDDFWGSWEWAQFESNMSKVLPGRPIEELPPDHPLFTTYYQIDSILQVPNVRNAEAVARGYPGAHTSEQDGFVPHVLGIFDDHRRLMVVINWNTDLGDAWEWAEDPFYPLVYSTYAWEMAANMIVYGMSH